VQEVANFVTEKVEIEGQECNSYQSVTVAELVNLLMKQEQDSIVEILDSQSPEPSVTFPIHAVHVQEGKKKEPGKVFLEMAW